MTIAADPEAARQRVAVQAGQKVATWTDTARATVGIYREVQGLSAADSHVGKKKELMAEIFRANLQLQKPKQTGS